MQRAWEGGVSGKKPKESTLREVGQEEKGIPATGVDAQSHAPISSAQVVSVGQEPVLFSGSVRDNIAYGLQSCSDEKVLAAAQAANAASFIQEMEHGLYTGNFSQWRTWSCFVGAWVVSL